MHGVAAVAVFIRSVLRNNRYLRNFAIVLYCIMLVKLFAIDFGSLSARERTSVFLVLGLFLIGFAFVYPKLLKSEGATGRGGDGATKRLHDYTTSRLNDFTTKGNTPKGLTLNDPG